MSDDNGNSAGVATTLAAHYGMRTIGIKHLINGIKIVADYTTGEVYVTDVDIPLEGLKTSVDLSRDSYDLQTLLEVWEVFSNVYCDINKVELPTEKLVKVKNLQSLKYNILQVRSVCHFDEKG